MTTVIKNARLIDESRDILADLLIRDGKIVAIGEGLQGDHILDLSGYTVMPAFTDLHVHFREPGFTHKEDIESGSRAAVAGGYTYVNMMGNTDPKASSMEVVRRNLNRLKEVGLIEGHQVVTVTENFDGHTLSHLEKLGPEVKWLSEDGKGVRESKVMYEAMVAMEKKGLGIMVHAEDMDMTPIDYRISENLETFRDLYLSEVTGCRLHLSHVSTREAIEAIGAAKALGVPVTCEVTPHHIALYDEDYRVNPPIRTKEDVEAVIEGILDGTVDAIATDHAPHTAEEKAKGAPGMVGLETAFAVVNTALVRTGILEPMDLSRLMSGEPARIMDIPKGRLEVGYDADLVAVNWDEKITVDPEKFQSKGHNTPFKGRELYGEVILTMHKGEIVYDHR